MSENNSKDPSVSQDYAKSRESQSFDIPVWGKIALLIALVALGSAGYLKSAFFKSGESAPVTQQPVADINPDLTAAGERQLLPDMTLVEENGTQHHLSDYKGQVVILSFWASWCSPCVVELPTFAAVEKKFKTRGLHVVTVNVDDGNDGKEFAKDFWTKNNFDFPKYFDTSKELSEKFKVDVLPANFVIDRQGRLAFAAMGANDWSSSQTSDDLESLLSEK